MLLIYNQTNNVSSVINFTIIDNTSNYLSSVGGGGGGGECNALVLQPNKYCIICNQSQNYRQHIHLSELLLQIWKIKKVSIFQLSKFNVECMFIKQLFHAFVISKQICCPEVLLMTRCIIAQGSALEAVRPYAM